MAGSSKVPPEVQSVLEAIEVLLVKRRIGRRDFERRIKLSAGGLSRMVSGKLVLKFHTLVEMLRVLEITPLAFFTAVFSEDASSEGADEVYRKVQALTLPEQQGPIILSRESLKDLIAEALTQLLHSTELSESAAPRKRRRPTKRPVGRGKS